MRLALVGFGPVGRGFYELLKVRHSTLQSEYGFAPTITTILTRHGAAYDPRGLNLQAEVVLTTPAIPIEAAMAEADVLVEVTPTDVQTGGAGLTHIRQALAMGKHVVTANKGPLVLSYKELAALARAKGVQFRIDTVISDLKAANPIGG